MFERTNETYGLKLNASPKESLNSLPIYMLAGRKLYEVEFEGTTFLAVCLSGRDRFNSAELKKQLALYQNAAEMPVAYVFDAMTTAQRTSLIGNRIPFICEPDQLYLPFLGVMLKSGLKKDRSHISTEKMSPSTQSLFLYLAYFGQSGCIKKDAANALRLTRTSITRASEQLTVMGLIREEKAGKEICMYPAGNGSALFERARPFLINPVQKSLFVKYDDALRQCLPAGESALSACTMLSPPKIPTYAVLKGCDTVTQFRQVEPRWESEEPVCRVELWKYDPRLFAADGRIDPISLAMSLESIDDERIEGALEDYLEGWKW